jgi:Spy/CpxP family protein refolding chaperone
MRIRPPRAQIRFLAGCLLGLWPLFAIGVSPEDGESGRSNQCETVLRRSPGPPMIPGFEEFGADHDEGPPPPYLMDVTLTEDQQDKVFAILHAAAPQLRENAKAARKARDALREFAQSAKYDDGNARMFAQAQASAEGQLALARVRLDRDIYLVLTAEQRAQIADRQHEWASQSATCAASARCKTLTRSWGRFSHE